MTALNIQLARDEVAHVLGGTKRSEGVYGGVDALAAGARVIKFAYGRVVDPVSLGEDGVVAVVLYGGTDVLGGSGDVVAYTHRIRIHLIYSVLRTLLHEADAVLTPFIPVIRTAFARKVHLNGAADNVQLESVSDIGTSMYADRLAIDFIFRVTQKEAVTFSP